MNISNNNHKYILSKELFIEKKIQTDISFINTLGNDRLSLDIIDYTNSGNIPDDSNVESVSYDGKDNLVTVNMINGKTVSMKIAKFLRKIEFDINDFEEWELERLINNFKENITDTIINIYNDEGNIKRAFLCDNYFFDKDSKDNHGNLLTSCMRKKEKQDYLELYYMNENISLLVLENKNKEILGRCILWTDERGDIYYDKIYVSYKKDESIINKYLSDNQIKSIIRYSTEVHIEHLPEEYPYLDTLFILDTERMMLSKSEWLFDDDKKGIFYKLKSEHGERIKGNWSEYEGYNIPESEAIWSEYLDSYINENDVEEMVYINGDEISDSIIKGEYAHEKDMKLITLSNKNIDNYFALNDEVVEIEKKDSLHHYILKIENDIYGLLDDIAYIKESFINDDYDKYIELGVEELISDNGNLISNEEIKNKYSKLNESKSNMDKDFNKWYMKNASLRGLADETNVVNNRSAMLGKGLYTAVLSNKSLAKEYGTVKILINARPKNPLKFNNLNEYEIWTQNNLYMFDGETFPNRRRFEKENTIEDAVMELGYDGIEIRGREYVNYKPENVLYFNNKEQVRDYFFTM